MKKYIFLDIDGVIATPEYIKRGLWTFNPEKIKLLERILDETGAKIIVSSSWRKSTVEETIEFFRKEGMSEKVLDNIIGVTIRGQSNVIRGTHLSIPRGSEIKSWIDINIRAYGQKILQNRIDYTYVILDDDTDFLLEQQPYFVKSVWNTGLTEELCNKAIKILNNESD